MTRLIVSLLHFLLIMLTILVVISFFYVFSSITYSSYNPIYSFLVYELGIKLDHTSFGFVGALIGIIIIAIIFGPLFILLEINKTLKDSNNDIKNLEKKLKKLDKN